MKKIVFMNLLLLAVSGSTLAQTKIKDGTLVGCSSLSGVNAILEGKHCKSLLLPRVGLTGTTNAAPLTAHMVGMVVFNDYLFYQESGKP